MRKKTKTVPKTKTAPKTKMVPKTKTRTKTRTAPENLEKKHLEKIYAAWMKVQDAVNVAEQEIGHKNLSSGFKAFDTACGRMEDAFVKLEYAIDSKEKGVNT